MHPHGLYYPYTGPLLHRFGSPRHWDLTINQLLLRRHWALAAHLPLPRTVTGPSPSTDSYYPVTSSMSLHWASRPRRHPATTSRILGPRCQNLHLLPRHWALTAIRLSLCQHWTLAAPLHAPSTLVLTIHQHLLPGNWACRPAPTPSTPGPCSHPATAAWTLGPSRPAPAPSTPDPRRRPAPTASSSCCLDQAPPTPGPHRSPAPTTWT